MRLPAVNNRSLYASAGSQAPRSLALSRLFVLFAEHIAVHYSKWIRRQPFIPLSCKLLVSYIPHHILPSIRPQGCLSICLQSPAPPLVCPFDFILFSVWRRRAFSFSCPCPFLFPRSSAVVSARCAAALQPSALQTLWPLYTQLPCWPRTAFPGHRIASARLRYCIAVCSQARIPSSCLLEHWNPSLVRPPKAVTNPFPCPLFYLIPCFRLSVNHPALPFEIIPLASLSLIDERQTKQVLILLLAGGVKRHIAASSPMHAGRHHAASSKITPHSTQCYFQPVACGLIDALSPPVWSSATRAALCLHRT